MTQPEVWLRGPVDGVPDMLQPAAHALLQVKEEIASILTDFPDQLLWERPAGLASVGFHLKHIPGVVDRLFTYARGEMLTQEQLRYLSEESEASGEGKDALLTALQQRIDEAVEEMRAVDPETLTDHRGVGRKKLPSTVIGMIFHAAEHSQRHLGQTLVTARVLTAGRAGNGG